MATKANNTFNPEMFLEFILKAQGNVSKAKTKSQFLSLYGGNKYRTQKAKSVWALRESDFNTPSFSISPIEDFIIDSTRLASLVGRFVRPCPVTPRHGFVDSRVVNSIEEAQQIIAETYKADPYAEIINMPLISAKYSAIWTNGSIIIGPGNDGATAGHDCVVIPVLGQPSNGDDESDNWISACKMAGITESPYVEMLWTDYNNEDAVGIREISYERYYVQLRNGPKVPSTTDYIPNKTKVTNVVEASGDLLEWETKVKILPKGTVVYHPGGSLASHYAVHAVLHGIPVVTSYHPKVGDILNPVSEEPKPNIRKFRAGFVYGCTVQISTQDATRILLAGCHNASLWYGKQDDLLGFAIGCAYRLIVAASLGEYRHRAARVLNIGSSGVSRGKVYRNVWDNILKSNVRQKYLRSVVSFQCDNWRGSFGGKKWFELSQWAGRLYNSLLDGNVIELMENLNKSVNAVHNGGWAFNKFVDVSEMDQAALNPMTAVQRIAPKLYIAKKEISAQESYLNRFYARRKKMDVSEKELPPKGSVSRAVCKLIDNELHIEYLLENMGNGKLAKDKFTTSVTLSEEGLKQFAKAATQYDVYQTYYYKGILNISERYEVTISENFPFRWLTQTSYKYKVLKSGDTGAEYIFVLGNGLSYERFDILEGKTGNIIIKKKYLKEKAISAVSGV